MAIMMLQDPGKLRVIQPFCTYLTDCPAAWQPLTIRHLQDALFAPLAMTPTGCDTSSRDVSAQLTFLEDSAGQVTGLTLRMDGNDAPAPRVK